MGVLGLAACGGGNGRPDTLARADASPQEQADALAAAFYADHKAIIDAAGEATGATDPTSYYTFDPAKDCDDIDRDVTQEEMGMLMMMVGKTVVESGEDMASFTKALNDYRAAVSATGVCD